MKKIFFITLAMIIFFSTFAIASEDIMNRPVATTSGTMLLMQADVISLHFSKTDFAYTPRLEGEKIKIKGVLLNDSLLYNKPALQQLMKRQVASFTKTLDERVALYVEDLKGSFKASRDVEFQFSTKAGDEIAVHKTGKWYFTSMKNLEPALLTPLPVETPKKDVQTTKYVKEDFWCNCPSLIKSKPKDIEEDSVVEEDIEKAPLEEESK